MKRKAFTLIELAIALTVIGIMIGGSFQAVKAMRERTKVAEAKEHVKAAKDSVMGYVITYPNLPTAVEFQNDLSPIKNNQNPIFYAADALLSTINNDVCAYTTTSLKVVDNGVTPARTINDIAFVVVHEGANYNMQTTLNGSNEVHLYGASAQVDDSPTPVNIIDYYDDVVGWVTLAELQRSVGCSNNPLRIVNNSLPTTDQNASYSAIIVIDGNYTVPTSPNFYCTIDAPYNIEFNWNYANFEIRHSNSSRPTGTAVVNCNVAVDGKSVSKRFVITIDP